MGTSEFALPTLRLLVASEHTVQAVYTQPPRPSGRGNSLHRTPVHICAEEDYNIPIVTPLSLKAHLLPPCDLVVLVAYGLMLPPFILQAPQHGCWNLHPSLLPRWRGAAPVARAIEAGDTQTGVCIMRMTAGLDDGPILLCEKEPILLTDTEGSLSQRLAEKGAHLMLKAISTMAQHGSILETQQDDAGSTYARKMEAQDTIIRWNQPVAMVDAQIRALTPKPGAVAIARERLKILEALPIQHREISHAPGTIFFEKKTLCVACRDGYLQLIRVQRQGKSPMLAQDFVNGMSELKKDARFWVDEKEEVCTTKKN